MQQALEIAREQGSGRPELPGRGPQLVPGNLPIGAPLPLLSTPEVRMAYLYEWVDGEGNKHFGEWVAIPLGGFDWIMSDGVHATIDGGSGEAAPAVEGH